MAKKPKLQKRGTFEGEVAFPSRYLCAADLKGKPVTVTIESVTRETVPMMDGGEQEKFVVRFEKAKKEWLMNVTCSEAIINVTGEREFTKWPGKQVTLYPTKCLAFGSMVDCVRVQERVRRPMPADEPPPAAADEAPPPTYDDIPFGG